MATSDPKPSPAPASSFSAPIRGARVFLDDGPALRRPLSARLQFNSGTRRIEVGRRPGTKYEGGIFVPRDDWRPPRTSELAMVAGEGPCEPARDIRVFAAPDWLYGFFWDLDLGPLLEGESFSANVDDPLFNAFCSEARRALKGRGIAIRNPTVRFQKARGRSTTYDPEFETFVGLHVDNFERRPIDTRHHSFPRLVVNLARQPRSLVFINLPLIALLDPSGIPQGRESYQKYCWAYPLAHAFMAAAPDYPVMRLTLEPGEGYVAPTQNLIHDGYTLGEAGAANDLDIVLSAFVDME